MKTLNSAFLTLLLALWASVAMAETYKVHGIVVNSQDQAPVVNHKLYLLALDVYDTVSVVTNQNGYYEVFYTPGDSMPAIIFTTDPCNDEKLYEAIPSDVTDYEKDFYVCSDPVEPHCEAMISYFIRTDSVTFADTSYQLQYQVTFIDSSNFEATSWVWDFGDDARSTDQNPTHTYETEGVYAITLEAANEVCSDATEDSIYIGHFDDCQADFTYVFDSISDDTINIALNSSDQSGSSVQFFDISSGNITQWHWNFGDGHTSSAQNPYHTYQNNGTYQVQLTAGNGHCSSFASSAIYIYDSTSFDTTCNSYFVVYPVDGLPNPDDTNYHSYGYRYHFENLSTGSLDSLLWVFGDGTTSEEVSPSHRYDTAGWYFVNLYLMGECNASYGQWLNVGENDTIIEADSCMAIFHSKISKKKVKFINESIGKFTEWKWDFGDGNTSTKKNPIHQYDSEGLYTVKLTAWSSQCESEFTSELYVGTTTYDSTLTAFFIPAIHDTKVIFHNKSTGDIDNYHWNFGDGTVASSRMVEHTYSSIGTYIVTLGIGNSNAVSTYTMEIDLATVTFMGKEANITQAKQVEIIEDMTVYPNPVIDRGYIHLQSSADEAASISVVNTAGQIVFTQKVTLIKGDNHFELPTNGLPQGLYILHISTETETKTSRIIK